MIQSAEELVDALQHAQEATSPAEKEIAAARLVKAELAHYEKLGLERRPNTFLRTATPLILITLLALTLALVVKFSYEANRTSERVAALQIENVLSNREACQRTNESRVASIEEKRQSVDSLSKQLAFWNAALEASKDQPPSPLTDVFLTFVEGLREERATKLQGIEKSIASQADVAIKPGSPRANCALAYPLP